MVDVLYDTELVNLPTPDEFIMIQPIEQLTPEGKWEPQSWETERPFSLFRRHSKTPSWTYDGQYVRWMISESDLPLSRFSSVHNFDKVRKHFPVPL